MMADTVRSWLDGGTGYPLHVISKRWLEFTGRTMQERSVTIIHRHSMPRLERWQSRIWTHSSRNNRSFLEIPVGGVMTGEYRWIMDTVCPVRRGWSIRRYIGTCMDLTRSARIWRINSANAEKESLLRKCTIG